MVAIKQDPTIRAGGNIPMRPMSRRNRLLGNRFMARSQGPCRVACFLVLGLILLGAAPATAPTSAPAEDAGFSAPDGIVTDLWAAPGGKHIVWATYSTDGHGLNHGTVLLQDTTTGKADSLCDLLELPRDTKSFYPQFSADGRMLLVHDIVKDINGYHVYDIEHKKTVDVIRKRSDTPYASWAGDRVALYGDGREMDVPLVLVEPFTGKQTELPVRGRLLAASPDGGVMLVLGIVGAPPATTRPFAVFAREARLHFLDPTGRPLRPDLDAMQLGRFAALSPDGKLAACKYPGMAVIPTGAVGSLRQVTVEDVTIKFANSAWGSDAQVKVAANPVAVTNAGGVLSFAPGLLRFTDPAGSTRTLAADFKKYSIAGDSIYYIRTERDAPRVNRVRIPER